MSSKNKSNNTKQQIKFDFGNRQYLEYLEQKIRNLEYTISTRENPNIGSNEKDSELLHKYNEVTRSLIEEKDKYHAELDDIRRRKEKKNCAMQRKTVSKDDNSVNKSSKALALRSNMIVKYLKYLRDGSRKIISGNRGFEKALQTKSKEVKPFKIVNNPLFIIKKEYDELDNSIFLNFLSIYNYLQKKGNSDKRLFIGFQTIYGNNITKKTLKAPLLYAECDMELSEKKDLIEISIDYSTLSLNHDLISDIMGYNAVPEDEYFDQDKLKKEENFNEIENELENFLLDIPEDMSHGEMKKVYENTINFSRKIFEKMQKEIDEFKEIKFSITSYTSDTDENKQSFISTHFHSSLLWNLSKDNTSTNDKGLFFTEESHYFVKQIPDNLSTFEALKFLIKEVDKNNFQNDVLNKLFGNMFDNNVIKLDYNISEHNIVEDYIKQYLGFLNLSENQKAALCNAFATEISYIQGPPGTGKSYTIASIIILALLLNKKVLVVSQKKAALDVVNNMVNKQYLSVSDSVNSCFPGVLYYEKDSRLLLKDILKNLESKLDKEHINIKRSQDINKEIAELEYELKKQNSKLSAIRELLTTRIESEKDFGIHNNTFHERKSNFSQIYYNIPDKFIFNKIRNKAATKKFIEKVKIIYNGDSTVINNWAKNKIKRYAKYNHQFPNEWLSSKSFNSLFTDYFEDILMQYTELAHINERIHKDEDTTPVNVIRTKLVNELKRTNSLQLNLIQKLIHKRGYGYFAKDPSYLDTLRSLRRMLHNKNASIISGQMDTLDYSKVTDVFPFWTAQIRDLGRIFPMKPNIFDLVIVDEASQVNLAEIFPAFYRGKRMVIVGDHKQLGISSSGVTFSISKKFDELTWLSNFDSNKYSFSWAHNNNLTVTTSSILDFVNSQLMNISIKNVLLDEHFRSLPNLAAYTNKAFYKNNLKIMTETAERINLETFMAIKVSGQRNEDKEIIEEVNKVIEVIKCLINPENENSKIKFPQHVFSSVPTIGVVSIIRNQCTAIKDILYQKISESDIDNHDIMVGTPEEFQGNERDVMIFSLCLDKDCARSASRYESDQHLNVATSRARKFTVFIYSAIPDNMLKIIKYLTHFIGEIKPEDLISSSNKIYSGIRRPWKFNFDKIESDFERKVCEYIIDDIINEYPQLEKYNQVHVCGEKRLDFVLYNPEIKKSVAIEVDGRMHFDGIGKKYTDEHFDRIKILKKAGWNIVNTPYHKWYKSGWLCDSNNNDFIEEVNRIKAECKKILELP